MATLLLLTNDMHASAEILPALELLPHQVKVAQAEATALLDAPSADVILLDARRDLVGARSLCRLIETRHHSAGRRARRPGPSHRGGGRGLLSRPGPSLMRIVAQRVSSARVEVDGLVVGAIDRTGLLIFVGVTHNDTEAVAGQLAQKIWTLRILRDERSCEQENAPLLVISQFTLYADTRKGRRPSWSAAAPRPVSEPLVDAFVAALRALGAEVETGVFGADMLVTSTNDGPVTMILDS